MPSKQMQARRKEFKKKPKPEFVNNGLSDETDLEQFLLKDARQGYNPVYDQSAFTAFTDVTPGTNVKMLNLNWHEQDLPERARTKHVHRLHPYLGKFIPQLVEIFLRKYNPRKVYDPFCGSGTTLVEASVIGIDSAGCDISPFNCLLSKVKTDIYDIVLLEKEIKDILLKFNVTVQQKRQPSLFGDRQLVSTDNDYLKRWFHPEALSELLTFRSFILQYKNQDLLKVILTRAARSSRLTTHFDLDFPKRPQTEPYYCYKHGRVCTPTNSAAKFINRYCLDTLDRVRQYMKLRTKASVQIIEGDAREAKLPTFDMVMTSPPYVGLIDYHEQHRYAYELLDLSRAAESKEIGAAKKGNSQQARKNYISEIEQVYRHALSFVPRNGVIVTVIGDRQGLFSGLAKNLNVKVEHILRRHVNRRTGRRSTDFYENVLVWRKR